MSERETDIAIVGFGPVGAFAAIQLAEAGLRVEILEKSRDLVELPRAVGLDGESVRSFQRLGLGDDVAAILQPPRDPHRVSFTDSKRQPYFALDMAPVGQTGWCDVTYFDQPELEALLRREVARRDGIHVHLGEDVVALEDSGSDVMVRSVAVEGGAESELRAAYVLGCDGASSFVRQAAGIEWLSLGYDQDWLVVDVIESPDSGLPSVMMQVCDPERLTTYVCVKDPNRRWEFQLLEGESRDAMLRPEKIAELLDPWVAPEHYELRRAAVYQFHAATADRWRRGRILLAGDSAHQTPPFLGQGLNSGFRDAVNLGWKLPLVLSGTCDEGLLDSYEGERDAHARELVEWAVAIGRLMETLAAREAGRPDPHEAVDQGAGYGQGRTVPPLRGGVLLAEQLRDEGPVGSQLVQPTVRTPEGTECKLDELFGRGFVVVGRTPEDVALGPDARAVLERLGGRTVSLADVEVVHGDMDQLFQRHPAAVLRPDRYIFGVVDDSWEIDRLLLALGAALALR